MEVSYGVWFARLDTTVLATLVEDMVTPMVILHTCTVVSIITKSIFAFSDDTAKQKIEMIKTLKLASRIRYVRTEKSAPWIFINLT